MFNFKLYKEGLRRLMFPALIFVSIMLLGAILQPGAQIQNQLVASAGGWARGRTIINNPLSLNFTLMFAMIFMTPILTLFQFSFLNKRHSSDFYHAIPHKRTSLYVSFLLATLTWILGAIWILSAVSLLIFAPFSHLIAVYTGALFSSLLQLSAGSILIAATILLAMSVTGGVFANIITGGLLLFLPRVVLAAFSTLVIDRVAFLPMDALGIIGNHALHIPFGMMTSTMFGISVTSLLPSIIYSTILALLYFALACVLFAKRPSEAAGNPALNSKVQAVIRISGAFALCLPATAIITSGGLRSMGSGDFFVLLGIYAFALICYFAYELITTRKWKNMIKILPGVGILILVNILFAVGVGQATNHFIRQDMQADNMQHVRILSLGPANTWGPNEPSYETLRAREVELSDPAVLEILTQALTTQQYELRHNIDPWSPGASLQTRAAQTTVSFQTNSGRTLNRIIRLSASQFETLTQQLAADEAYSTAFLTMPEDPSSLWIRSLNDYAATREIYQTLLEEVASIDPAIWVGLQSGFWGEDIIFYDHVVAFGFVQNTDFRSEYPITSLTPRTAQLLFYHSTATHLAAAIAVFSNEHFEADNGWASLVSFDGPHTIHLDFWDLLRTTGSDLLPYLVEVLSVSNTGLDNTEHPLFRLEFSGSLFNEETQGWTWHNGTVYFRTDSSILLNALQAGHEVQIMR